MKNFVKKALAFVLAMISMISLSTFTPSPAFAATASGNVIVSQAEISAAAATYGVPTSSTAYQALQRINSYYNQLSGSQNGTLVFFFEGVGNNSSPSYRMNAMCVVVKNNRIKYINLNSSTIPDYPFDPSKNGGDPMPTMKSGVYGFTTVNHKGIGSTTPAYAALHINNALVLRHYNANNYYDSTSDYINIHRRSTDYIPSGRPNSAGCLIVGKTPNLSSTSSEYARFIQAVGIVGSNGTAASVHGPKVTGKVIIDRSYADQYLAGIGYKTGARAKLNTSQTYYLDINCKVNGTLYSNMNGIGTADVYIDGVKVANDVSDFYTLYLRGTSWKITDIKAKLGYLYIGPGTITGTLNETHYEDLKFIGIPVPSPSWSTNFRMKAGAYFNAYDGVSGNYVGRIYPNDVIRVTTVYDSGWMKVECPWSGGTTKIVYLPFNGFQFKATKYINAYDSANGAYVGRVYPNDLCTVQSITRDGWMRCSCPWTGNTTRIIYIRCTDIY